MKRKAFGRSRSRNCSVTARAIRCADSAEVSSRRAGDRASVGTEDHLSSQNDWSNESERVDETSLWNVLVAVVRVAPGAQLDRASAVDGVLPPDKPNKDAAPESTMSIGKPDIAVMIPATCQFDSSLRPVIDFSASAGGGTSQARFPKPCCFHGQSYSLYGARATKRTTCLEIHSKRRHPQPAHSIAQVTLQCFLRPSI